MGQPQNTAHALVAANQVTDGMNVLCWGFLGVQQEEKKLSTNFYDLYDVDCVSGNPEFSESFDDLLDIISTATKGDFFAVGML